MSCAIFFKKDNMVYQLPVNPEQIDTSSVQAIQKYEVLKLGQIAIPTHMELREYSFEVELPHRPLHYVETSEDFREPSFYLGLFREWRDSNEPVRFISTDGIGEDIDTLVLFEEVNEVDKAGEEGDKYISLKLLEYREFSKKTAYVVENEIMPFSIKPVSDEENPKSTGNHVVVAGDTLWSIAKKYYGDGSKANIIYNANKDKIKNPALISIGWNLKIPSKDEFAKYNFPLSSVSDERRKQLLDMAAGLSSVNAFDKSVAGIGSSNSSSSKKIVIYQSDYNAQGVRSGVPGSGRKYYLSGGGKL